MIRPGPRAGKRSLAAGVLALGALLVQN